jgi:hypothetical protein
MRIMLLSGGTVMQSLYGGSRASPQTSIGWRTGYGVVA